MTWHSGKQSQARCYARHDIQANSHKQELKECHSFSSDMVWSWKGTRSRQTLLLTLTVKHSGPQACLQMQGRVVTKDGFVTSHLTHQTTPIWSGANNDYLHSSLHGSTLEVPLKIRRWQGKDWCYCHCSWSLAGRYKLWLRLFSWVADSHPPKQSSRCTLQQPAKTTTIPCRPPVACRTPCSKYLPSTRQLSIGPIRVEKCKHLARMNKTNCFVPLWSSAMAKQPTRLLPWNLCKRKIAK